MPTPSGPCLLITGPPGSTFGGRAARRGAAVRIRRVPGCGERCPTTTMAETRRRARIIPEDVDRGERNATSCRSRRGAQHRTVADQSDEAPTADRGAANALLKVVEPPPSTVFLLCAVGGPGTSRSLRSRWASGVVTPRSRRSPSAGRSGRGLRGRQMAASVSGGHAARTPANTDRRRGGDARGRSGWRVTRRRRRGPTEPPRSWWPPQRRRRWR
jgi:hypothetical protein